MIDIIIYLFLAIGWFWQEVVVKDSYHDILLKLGGTIITIPTMLLFNDISYYSKKYKFLFYLMKAFIIGFGCVGFYNLCTGIYLILCRWFVETKIICYNQWYNIYSIIPWNVYLSLLYRWLIDRTNLYNSWYLHSRSWCNNSYYNDFLWHYRLPLCSSN